MHEQNDRRSLGPIENCNSDQKVAVLSATTTHDGWDTETSNSDANHVVLHAQKHSRGLGPIETSNSSDNHAVFHAQNDW